MRRTVREAQARATLSSGKEGIEDRGWCPHPSHALGESFGTLAKLASFLRLENFRYQCLLADLGIYWPVFR
jgi:hypothetical protein